MSEKKTFQSTQIFEGEYFPETKKMHLTFRTGKKKYEYDNIPPEVWQGLCDAESHGKFFSQAIKARYPFRRIEQLPFEGDGLGDNK